METIGNVVHVDDTSPAINYTGNWQALTGSSRQFMQTVHDASSVGSTASLSWRGTQVTVIGTVPVGTGSTITSYQLDDGTPATATFKCGPTAVFGQIFWDSGVVRDGLHTLVITNEGTTADFQLDEIDYVLSVNAPDTNSTSSGVVSSTASSSSTTPGAPAVTVTIVSSNVSQKNSTPVGAIAGGVIGGLIVILAIILAFLWWRRKRTNRSDVLEEKSTLTPFDITESSAARPVDESATPQMSQKGLGVFLMNNGSRNGLAANNNSQQSANPIIVPHTSNLDQSQSSPSPANIQSPDTPTPAISSLPPNNVQSSMPNLFPSPPATLFPPPSASPLQATSAATNIQSPDSEAARRNTFESDSVSSSVDHDRPPAYPGSEMGSR